MTMRRKLLGGLVATAVGVTLVLQAAAPAGAAAPGPDLSRTADRIEAELAEAPDLSGAEAVGSGTVVLTAPPDAAGAGINAPPPVITCFLFVFNPQTATGDPTKVQATAAVVCDWWMPSITVGVALFRQGTSHDLSKKTATVVVLPSASVSTFTPCKTGVYFAAATATIVVPFGYSPPVLQLAVVSNPVPIVESGTPVPPLTCAHAQPPPPDPDPPPPPPIIPDPPFCPNPSHTWECNEP